MLHGEEKVLYGRISRKYNYTKVPTYHIRSSEDRTECRRFYQNICLIRLMVFYSRKVITGCTGILYG